MTTRYHVHLDGPNTRITENPAGPWPRWEMARAAAIEHIEELAAECEETLLCLQRAGNFWEFELLKGEMAGSKADELDQVQPGDTLT